MTANVNVTKVLFKRGNTAQNAAYTGINGEITVDTQVKTLRIHDGVTTGGNIVTAGAMASYIPTDPTITSIQANVAAANAAISAITGIDTSLLANAATQQTQINLINANVAAANALIPNLLAVSGNILPSANITYSLGSEQFQWRDLWVSNNTIYIGNTPVRVDGNTLLINGAPVSGAYGNTQVAAYLPTYTGNITAGNLTITGNIDQPNRGFGNGPGTDLYITAGHTQGCSIPGGDTIISGGLGYGGVAWYGGNVTLRTGRLTSNNYSNQWNFAYDGTLTLPNADFGYSPIEPAILFPVPGFNGSKIQIANNGLTITAETQTWTFGTDGNLTFPTGGNLIFDSSSTSVIDGVTNITANGNVTAAQYNFANGVNILSTIGGGSYANADVKIYLESLSNVNIGVGTGINQGADSVAIGPYAGNTSQSNFSIAIGSNGFYANLFGDEGYSAGGYNQGTNSIAIGTVAGAYNQGYESIAIGDAAGTRNQGVYSIAIGAEAGEQSQGYESIAIGVLAGYENQGINSVALGRDAGRSNQGNNAVALGYQAGYLNQAANSIVISTQRLDADTSGFFVDPIRNQQGNVGILQYVGTTKEIVYSNNISVTGNVSTSTVITTPATFANLVAVSGARAFVNDANIAAAGNFGAAISGGGANTAPVWSDGTSWYIG